MAGEGIFVSGTDIGFGDRDGFKRGVHWLFLDAPEDVLWVTFSTAGRRPGSFNNFRSLAAYPGKKLFLADPESYYYQDLIEHIIALLGHIREKFSISHAIYWGSSMGAYGALLFGALGVIPGRCYAFAPQFDLRHPGARAARWIKNPARHHRTYADLRPMLTQRGFRDLNVLLPCFDYSDGIHVADARRMGHHDSEIALVGTTHRVLEDFVAKSGRPALEACYAAALGQRDVPIPAGFTPSERDIELSILAYACMEHLAGRGERPDLSIDDTGTANHAWLNAKLRVLTTERQFAPAIEAGLRSLTLMPGSIEYLICTANAYAASGLSYADVLAEGLYRQAARLRPRDETIRRILANSLTQRGLGREVPMIGTATSVA